MEDTKTTNVATSTEKKDEKATVTIAKKHTVKAPLFLLYAEYLGKVSKVIDWVDDWCKGNEPDEIRKDIIENDALNIFNKLKDEIGEEELAKWFDEFYDVILSEYEAKLNAASDKSTKADTSKTYAYGDYYNDDYYDD